ncbi:hypothetical protein RchiOBHm_Chr7g0211701 [Rosa chinensis]|uniref:Uncharacterized protein n=1 Tax=Rosa chinensis TaxID=74649 RepID=A0A2P6PAI3_ROSCH|nr:hypothetical protein RchiOBHm_Chr7g0211701 [Rosa chinensis]
MFEIITAVHRQLLPKFLQLSYLFSHCCKQLKLKGKIVRICSASLFGGYPIANKCSLMLPRLIFALCNFVLCCASFSEIHVIYASVLFRFGWPP